jgi:hypothetical protein
MCRALPLPGRGPGLRGESVFALSGHEAATLMRALKILVVVMGVMLVGGTAALIAAIIDRASRHTPTASAPPSSRGFGHAAVTLPPGARVVTAELAGDRILVRLAREEGGEALIIIDAKSGAPLGTIDLLPSNAVEAKP